jgi:hypothetical protein
MRVLLDRPEGKPYRATLVAYLPPFQKPDPAQVARYFGPRAPAYAAEASNYGRHVFHIDGTQDIFYVCPDTDTGRQWWRPIRDKTT